MDWNGRLEHRAGLLDYWTGILDYWNGLQLSNCLLEMTQMGSNHVSPTCLLPHGNVLGSLCMYVHMYRLGSSEM